MGFSSGLTTGIWMGRDDARAVRGLQGGTAPARAFSAFMQAAIANRKVEPFDTEVTLPEWQLEPDAEAYFGTPDNGVFVDADGNPVGDVPNTTEDMVSNPGAPDESGDPPSELLPQAARPNQ